MSGFRWTQVIMAAAILATLNQARGHADDLLPAHAGTRVLRSGSLAVEVGDPESDQCKWNKGLRFSPVANVLRAELGGQEFLYSPVSGGVLSFLGGLPMEFDIGQEAFQPDPPGYNEGTSGDPFLKVGVGILKRDGAAYDFSKTYPVVELARTAVTWQADRAHFVQTLTGTANGYACRLEEDVIVKNDRLVLNYRLHNTGSKPFTTEQYLHNFLCFRGRSVGPNVRLSFPYDFTTKPVVAAWQPPPKGRTFALAAAQTVARIANMIEFLDKATSVPKIWVYKPEGYAGPDRFIVEHTQTLQRMTLEASIPSVYVGIWTTDYQVSPEQFLPISLAPGEEARFARTYVFRADGFVPQDSTGAGTVDGNDLAQLSLAWLSEPDAANWQASCDISSPPDDRIDLRDVAGLACQWRQAGGLPAPLAQWKFDETTGNTAGDDRGRHPAVLHNFAGDDSQWLAGVAGGGLQFDGADDYAEVSGCFGITDGQPRTITAWVKLNEKPTANQAILAWGEPAAGRYWLLEVDANRKLRFSCGGGFAIASARLIGDTQWHHIAAVLDPMVAEAPRVSDVRLYVDAALQPVYESAEAALGTGDTAALRLGASFDPNESRPLNGIVDDVRIYDAPLNAANLRHIYREAVPQ